MDNSVTEKNAPWGLARISHRDGLSFGNFNKYLYTEEGGEGVDVYIIDTGTNVAHVDFEGRASWGKTIPDGDEDADGNGHGTHCSGTAVGKKYGVAKKAHVKAVKVLRSNGSGSMSDVVKGVEFAVEAHLKSVEDAKKGKKKGFKGSTANMSLGGGKSVTLDKAVNAAVEFGLHFAVAAGNDNADSCKYSPAAAANAVTVGASSFADERAYFSNYGTCNDIFAPGLNILSTWIGSKYATNTISGTSMASPHIAGLLAYMLSLQPAIDSDYAVASISPKKLKANLIAIATEGALTNVPSNTANVSNATHSFASLANYVCRFSRGTVVDLAITLILSTKAVTLFRGIRVFLACLRRSSRLALRLWKALLKRKSRMSRVTPKRSPRRLCSCLTSSRRGLRNSSLSTRSHRVGFALEKEVQCLERRAFSTRRVTRHGMDRDGCSSTVQGTDMGESGCILVHIGADS